MNTVRDASAHGPRVFDVPVDWELPAPGKKVLPPGGRIETERHEDVVTAYDTADLLLDASGVSLRRGSGATAPWTLRVDGTTSRYPAAGRGVPAEVRGLLLGLRRGAALRVAGRARVERTVHRILDAEGVELGTVTEVVTGPAAAARTAEARRYVEIAGWEGSFLDALARRLVKSDAVERAAAISQVPVAAAPAAGARAADATDSAADGEPVEPAPGTVGAAVIGYLRTQRAAVLRADLGIRRGEDTVHAFRVAIRRIRSALRVVNVADAEQVAGFDAELRWLSAALGAVRDLEVLQSHLAASLLGLGERAEVDLAPAGELLTAALDADRRRATAALTTTLSGRRYLALLRTLDRWCTAAPLTEAAAAPDKHLARYVKAAAKDLDRRLAKAGGSARKLHGARKAAKRARYVASFAGQAAGKHGAGVERHAKSLQTSLGDHQDCVLAAEYVARAAAGASGAAAFGCGVVWAHEQRRAAAALTAAQEEQAGHVERGG